MLSGPENNDNNSIETIMAFLCFILPFFRILRTVEWDFTIFIDNADIGTGGTGGPEEKKNLFPITFVYVQSICSPFPMGGNSPRCLHFAKA